MIYSEVLIRLTTPRRLHSTVSIEPTQGSGNFDDINGDAWDPSKGANKFPLVFKLNDNNSSLVGRDQTFFVKFKAHTPMIFSK